MNTTKVQFLAKLDASILQIDDLWLLWLSIHSCHHIITEERKPKEIRINKLILADLRVHEAKLVCLLVLEAVRVGANLRDLLLFAYIVQQIYQLALDEAEPDEVVVVFAINRVGHNINPNKVSKVLAKKAEPFEEFGPTGNFLRLFLIGGIFVVRFVFGGVIIVVGLR